MPSISAIRSWVSFLAWQIAQRHFFRDQFGGTSVDRLALCGRECGTKFVKRLCHARPPF
jgi:hypothetical protein